MAGTTLGEHGLRRDTPPTNPPGTTRSVGPSVSATWASRKPALSVSKVGTGVSAVPGLCCPEHVVSCYSGSSASSCSVMDLWEGADDTGNSTDSTGF